MITITKDQMAASRASALAAYHRQLLAYFRADFPERTQSYDDAALLQLIATGQEKADRYGITSTEGIVQFIGLMLILSPTFDDDPQVHQYLTEPLLDPAFKLDLLVELLTDRLSAALTA